MMPSDACSFVVLYRWRIKPGLEDRFAAAWSEATQRLLALGSLGSRLHRGDDGLWYGYAQWPSAVVRANAFSAADDTEVALRMREAIEESLPEIVMTPVSDYLQPLP